RHCTDRWSRRSSMNKGRAGVVGRVGLVGCASALAVSLVHAQSRDDVRQIVQEAQRRTDAKSQRYEGLLQVFDAKGKISDKRWTYDRLGAHGQSKAVLRFTAPAEVK